MATIIQRADKVGNKYGNQFRSSCGKVVRRSKNIATYMLLPVNSSAPATTTRIRPTVMAAAPSALLTRGSPIADPSGTNG